MIRQWEKRDCQAAIRLVLEVQNVEYNVGLTLDDQRSHRFYERMGFRRVTAEQLPVPYNFVDEIPICTCCSY